MNRTLSNLAIAGSVVGGVAVGATLVGTAGAYGDEPSTDTDTETTAEVEETVFVPVQDDLPAEPEVEGDAEETDGRRGHRGGCSLEAVAEAIGVDEDALRAELDAGSSIADVAAANGVDVDVVVDAILDAKEDRLDAKVESGRLTEAEAEERLAGAEERALERVNQVRGDDTADA
ncbi:MAG: hypothetical protein AAF548_01605 [Actinomycetota bacterium]